MKRKSLLIIALLITAVFNLCSCNNGTDSQSSTVYFTGDTSSAETTSSTVSTKIMSIHFFNAGKADACLISDGSRNVMIDTGENTLSDELLLYFNENGITKLDYLIITHFDKDHVGSASEIINSIDVENVLQSNVPKESVYYDNYLEALKNKEMTAVTVSQDLTFDLGEMKFTVNAPAAVYEKNESNNSSLITSLVYGDTSFIFMGDAQKERLNDFIFDNTKTYDFVKIPYHGNYQKKLYDLLDNIEPKYAVITSSDKEPEKEEMLEILKDKDISYYLTREGAVDIATDGKEINITQQR